MWEIYSVGDSAFLERVLIALGMFSGTGNLEQVAAIGMLIGLIIAGFKSIMNGGTGIKFQDLLVSWVIFMMIFGGGSRVAIEDSYTNTVRVVDNVPQGVAIAGSMVSRLGYGITTLFEQAYSDVAMTEYGFAYALDSLSKTRKAFSSKSALGAANSPLPGDDIWQSWSNYISECTMVGVDLGEFTLDQIQTSSRFPNESTVNQLRYDNPAYGTFLYLATARGPYSCTEAFGYLESYTRGEFVTALDARLAAALKVDPSVVPTSRDNALLLLGQSGENSQDLMVTMAMTPIFEWAKVGNELDFNRVASAAMLHDSIQQRNELWAADQALFNTVVQPMMTFFEALIFAITPMMAFLIGLGSIGFSLIGKYIMMLFWIQLWMPVMSIINLYLHMSVAGQMEALQAHNAGRLPLDSFYGIYSLDVTLQTWMATAGMLAASVPGITLMLVYGSSVTASSIASRISSGSSSAEASTPKLLSNSPVVENSSHQSRDRASGQRDSGSDSMATQISFGKNWTHAEQSARQEMSSATSQASAALTERVSEMEQSGVRAFDKIGAAYSQTGSASHTDQYLMQLGRSAAAQAGLGETLTDQQASAVGLQMSLSKGKAGGRAGMDASTAQSLGLSKDQMERLNKQISLTSGNSTSDAAGLVEALAKDQAEGVENSVSRGLGLSNDRTVQESLGKVKQASDSYQAASGFTESNGMQTTFNALNLSKTIQDSPQLSEMVNNYAQKYGHVPGFNQSAGDYAAMAQSKHHLSPDQARVAGIAMAMVDGSYLENMPSSIRGDAISDAGNVFRSMIGQAPLDRDAAHELKGVSGDLNNNRLQPLLEQPVSGPSASPENIRAGVDSGIEGAQRAIGSTNPEQFYASNDAKFAQEHRENEQAAFAPFNQDLARGMEKGVADSTRAGMDYLPLGVNTAVLANGFKPEYTERQFSRLPSDEQEAYARKFQNHIEANMTEKFDDPSSQEYFVASAAMTRQSAMFKGEFAGPGAHQSSTGARKSSDATAIFEANRRESMEGMAPERIAAVNTILVSNMERTHEGLTGQLNVATRTENDATKYGIENTNIKSPGTPPEQTNTSVPAATVANNASANDLPSGLPAAFTPFSREENLPTSSSGKGSDNAMIENGRPDVVAAPSSIAIPSANDDLGQNGKAGNDGIARVAPAALHGANGSNGSDALGGYASPGLSGQDGANGQNGLPSGGSRGINGASGINGSDSGAGTGTHGADVQNSGSNSYSSNTTKTEASLHADSQPMSNDQAGLRANAQQTAGLTGADRQQPGTEGERATSGPAPAAAAPFRPEQQLANNDQSGLHSDAQQTAGLTGAIGRAHV